MVSKISEASGQLEILRNRFQAVVDEMSWTLFRTGHTVFIKETNDFSCALVTPDGEVFSAPSRIGTIRVVGMDMSACIEASKPCHAGEVWVSNDPRSTNGMSTHLPDLFFWRPIYFKAELICYAWNFIHVSDIGGRVPGSILPSAREIYEEGLILPPCRIYRNDEVEEQIRDIILANCRIPEQTWGDIKAAVAALMHAERRILEIGDRFGWSHILEGQQALLDWAESRATSILRDIPDGTYEFTDYIEGAPSLPEPIKLQLAVTFNQGKVQLDFTGSSPEVPCAYNLQTGGRGPHQYLIPGLVTYLRTIDPSIPYNNGLARPVSSNLPSGSVVNPGRNAAVGIRVATMFRIYDLVLGCLAQAQPQVVPAAGGGEAGILMVSVPGSDGSSLVSVIQPLRGGSGGRPWGDGPDGNDLPIAAGARNIPTEVIEQDVPILVHRFGLKRDSSGAGKYRGGMGLELEFELLASGAVVTCRGLERYQFRPWGRLGGSAGGLGRTVLTRVDAGPEDVGRFDVLYLDKGDRLYFATQGGGGWGDPLERSLERVLEDLVQDRITTWHAARNYGVVTYNGRVNQTATKNKRQQHLSSPRPLREFDFGLERENYENESP